MSILAPAPTPDGWDDWNTEDVSWDELEPTDADLFAIEAEWDQVAAELATVDAVVRWLVTTSAQIDAQTRRRIRRTETRILSGHTCTKAAGRTVRAEVCK